MSRLARGLALALFLISTFTGRLHELHGHHAHACECEDGPALACAGCSSSDHPHPEGHDESDCLACVASHTPAVVADHPFRVDSPLPSDRMQSVQDSKPVSSFHYRTHSRGPPSS